MVSVHNCGEKRWIFLSGEFDVDIIFLFSVVEVYGINPLCYEIKKMLLCVGFGHSLRTDHGKRNYWQVRKIVFAAASNTRAWKK